MITNDVLFGVPNIGGALLLTKTVPHVEHSNFCEHARHALKHTYFKRIILLLNFGEKKTGYLGEFLRGMISNFRSNFSKFPPIAIMDIGFQVDPNLLSYQC